MNRTGRHALGWLLLAAAGLARLAVSPAETQGEEPGLPDFAASLANLNDFDRAAPMAYAAFRRPAPEDWYRILSAMHNLLVQHQGHFRSLDRRAQAAVIVRLGDFLLRKRKEKSADRLMAPGRKVLAIFRENDHFESRRESRAGLRRGPGILQGGPTGRNRGARRKLRAWRDPGGGQNGLLAPRRGNRPRRQAGDNCRLEPWKLDRVRCGRSSAHFVARVGRRHVAGGPRRPGAKGRPVQDRFDARLLLLGRLLLRSARKARTDARESRTRLVPPNSITASWRGGESRSGSSSGKG